MCNLTLPTKQTFDEHNETVQEALFAIINVKLHQCSICEFKSKKKQDITRHETEVHEDLFKKYQCGACGYVSEGMEVMKLHSKIHENMIYENEMKCCYCEVKFPTIRFLKDHCLAVHEKENNFGNYPTLL